LATSSAAIPYLAPRSLALVASTSVYAWACLAVSPAWRENAIAVSLNFNAILNPPRNRFEINFSEVAIVPFNKPAI
jgi:hypothetical protein